jgi:hypothetical protein
VKFYSTQEITDAWKSYRTGKVLAILDKGEWRIEPMNGQVITKIEGTKAERRWVRDAYSFPEYLEKVELWKK